jgi:hypothetical protein
MSRDNDIIDATLLYIRQLRALDIELEEIILTKDNGFRLADSG